MFDYVSETRFIQFLLRQFPVTARILSERFSLNRFKGFPLTILILVFIANLFLFDEIAESFENSPAMMSIDKSFAEFLFIVRNQHLANVFYYFSKLGSLSLVIGIALITFLIFSGKRKFIYAYSLLIALAGTGITVLIGKNYFQRIRPNGFSYYPESSYSFPSGHAILAVAFYGLIFYSLIRHSKKYKLHWSVLSVLFILLLGFSRLYLGVHYLSDVLAGYSLGFLWLLLAISIIEWKTNVTKPDSSDQ